MTTSNLPLIPGVRVAPNDHRGPDMAARVERVVIINDASTAWGGATGLALLSAELLTARGVPVTFVAGDKGDGEKLAELGVEIVAVGGRGLVHQGKLKAMKTGLYNTAARDRLAAWIRDNDGPGVVYHLHGWSKILSPAIFDALRPVAPRTVIHAHDFFLACPNGGFMDYRHDQPCGRVPLGVDCLTTNCDKRTYGQKLWRVGRQKVLRARFLGPPWARIVMIHGRMAPYLEKAGIDPRLMFELPNPTEPICTDRVTVETNRDFLFIGRVEAEKGIEDAIAAARLAGVPLKVIGEGPLRMPLTRQYPEVDFLGWKSREDMAGILAGARALIMPSRYPEPYGLVAAEAARSGLPVILAQTAFLGPDFLRLGIGLCCDTRDPDRLAAAIAVIRDMEPARIREMSLRARREADRVSTTPGAWIEGLMAQYTRTVR